MPSVDAYNANYATSNIPQERQSENERFSRLFGHPPADGNSVIPVIPVIPVIHRMAEKVAADDRFREI